MYLFQKYLLNSNDRKSCIKALIFGIIISIISCYFGFNASGGAEGVGRATTISVVTSSTLILTSTYFVTALFI